MRTFFFLLLHFCNIAFVISNQSWQHFDPLQHPFCSVVIKCLSSVHFCIHLLMIDVMVLYIVGRHVVGL